MEQCLISQHTHTKSHAHYISNSIKHISCVLAGSSLKLMIFPRLPDVVAEYLNSPQGKKVMHPPESQKNVWTFVHTGFSFKLRHFHTMPVEKRSSFERDSHCSSDTEGLKHTTGDFSALNRWISFHYRKQGARWETEGMETVSDCKRFHTPLLKAWQGAEGNFYVCNQVTCIWHEQELAKIKQTHSGAPTAAQFWFLKQEDRRCTKLMEKALEWFKKNHSDWGRKSNYFKKRRSNFSSSLSLVSNKKR